MVGEMNMDPMKVSIITATFNSKKRIEQTIKSVMNQTYPNIEYIVVDGCSNDGTIDIVKRYKHFVSKFI